MKKKKKFLFGFIGIGRMAAVILQNLIAGKVAPPKRVLVSRRNRGALNKIKKKWGVEITSDNKKVAGGCDLLWIGVKPFQAGEVLREIRPDLNSQTTVVSMMAGVSYRFLRHHLGGQAKIIRMMPNTPALLGHGITGVFFPKNIPGKTRRRLLKILKGFGEVLVTRSEKDLDAVTGLSGSGPAFVYEMAQGLIQGGLRSKLKSAEATRLTLHTLLGAARMLQQTGKSPETLIQQVLSKGGTTEAGIKELRRRKTAAQLAQAVVLATRRAKKIREETERCIP